MPDTILEFTDELLLGKVSSVDTSRVHVNVENAELLIRIGVGNLIAIQGHTNTEYLIGFIERVTRSTSESFLTDDISPEGEIGLGISQTDKLVGLMIGTFRGVEGTQRNTFKRGTDSFPQIDRNCYFIDGANLQRLMDLLGSDVAPEHQLKLGSFAVDRTATAIANGNKLFQRHLSILGSTGSGKSWAVALLLEKASKLSHPNLVVFDIHGEYKPLTDGSDGIASHLRIAGPGDLSNPEENVLFLPYWLLNREEMLSMILDRSDQNAPNQASRFTLHVRNLKEKTLDDNSKTDVKETFTVDSPIPYDLSDLIAELNADNTRKGQGKTGPIKGEWEGKLTRFISRLTAKADDRRYGFLFQPPDTALEYDWLSNQIIKLLDSSADVKGIKIVDFSEVPSDVLPVVTGTLARLLYDIQFWLNRENRTPFTLVCDEAHLYLPVKDDSDSVEKQALYTFERIAKEGRKYGVSIVAVSQRPSDVSRTILSQCNNFIILRLTNDRDQSVVKRIMPDSMSALVDSVPLLDTGEALLLGDSILLPSRIKLDRPDKKPESSTREFWTEWESSTPSVTAISDAVETLRKQTRSN